jgi:hypothetical protein
MRLLFPPPKNFKKLFSAKVDLEIVDVCGCVMRKALPSQATEFQTNKQAPPVDSVQVRALTTAAAHPQARPGKWGLEQASCPAGLCMCVLSSHCSPALGACAVICAIWAYDNFFFPESPLEVMMLLLFGMGLASASLVSLLSFVPLT